MVDSIVEVADDVVGNCEVDAKADRIGDEGEVVEASAAFVVEDDFGAAVRARVERCLDLCLLTSTGSLTATAAALMAE